MLTHFSPREQGEHSAVPYSFVILPGMHSEHSVFCVEKGGDNVNKNIKKERKWERKRKREKREKEKEKRERKEKAHTVR